MSLKYKSQFFLIFFILFSVFIFDAKAETYSQCYTSCIGSGGSKDSCDKKCAPLDTNSKTFNGVTATNTTTTSTTEGYNYYETHGSLSDPSGKMIYAQPGSASTPSTSTPKTFTYTLLESIPGFYNAKSTLTDLPALVLAIYKFGIWTVGIAGLFMITIGGIMYMTSAGNKSTAGSAKGVITDAIFGIVGALTAYLFMYVINPDLVNINLNFTSVKVSEAEDAQVSGSTSTTTVTRNGQLIDVSFDAALTKIKNESNINTVVTSGLRTVQKQKELIAQNCGGYPATKACFPPTCLLKNGSDSCPHTTGRAADIWALNSSGQQAISQANCQSNISACFQNQYQQKLISAMKANGFCVLRSEPWHFEKPKMSSACDF